MAERIRIVFVGDSHVGKTTIIKKFCDDSSDVQPTIGAANYSRTISGPSGPVLLHLSDTAGQERYQALTPLYLRTANVAIMVFDLTVRASFDNLTATWLSTMQAAPEGCVRVLVGNKSDLGGAAVSGADIERAREQLEAAGAFQVSALTGAGIDPLFSWIASDTRVPRDQGYQPGVSAETRIELSDRAEARCC